MSFDLLPCTHFPFSVAKGRFFIETTNGIVRHTLFEKSYRLINKGFRYEKMSAPDNVCAATEGAG